MKKFTLILSLTTLAAITGCSTTARPGNYECELRDNPASKCASMQSAYKSSQGLTSAESANVQTVFEANATQPRPAANTAPIVGAQASGYPDVGEAGMPVFKQPKVLRVWVAPYVDADGNLRSGEYTYFSTPGQWNYGDLKKSGVASGMFTPAKAENLGFTAAPAKQPTVKPLEAVRTEQSTGQGPSTSSQGSSAAGANANIPQITQPYQRLTN
jgi:conjugal transfer pilus assembly protein TraV